MRSRDELVRMRLDPDGGTNENSGPDATVARYLDQSVDLIERIDNDVADADVDGLGDLGY